MTCNFSPHPGSSVRRPVLLLLRAAWLCQLTANELLFLVHMLGAVCFGRQIYHLAQVKINLLNSDLAYAIQQPQ